MNRDRDERKALSDEAAAKMMALLLALPWDVRADAFATVRYNSIFCTSCGQGEPTSPNQNCQCMNDE